MNTISPPRRGRELIAMLGVAALLLGSGLAFAWPWRTELLPPANDLPRFAPRRNGTTTLYTQHDGVGNLRGWRSENTRVIALQRAFASELRQGASAALIAFYAPPNPDLAVLGQHLAARGVELTEVRNREWSATGVVTETVDVFVRDTRGDFQVSSWTPATGFELVFNPPVLILDAQLVPGQRWESQGTLNDVPYRAEGRVVGVGPHSSSRNTFADCREVELALTLTPPEGAPFRTSFRWWWCQGVGLLEGEQRTNDGPLELRTTAVSVDQPSAFGPPLPALPPTSAVAAAAPPADIVPATWQFTRLGRLIGAIYAGETTIAPVYVASDPPLIVTATSEGDVVAFAADDPTRGAVWRFHTGGPVYSPPTFDPARNLLFWGSSDKRVYAANTDGVFRWSFATGDNVAARPAVIGDMLVVASEDRRVYGLDIASGAERWRYTAGAAVVGGAAIAGDLAIIGGDDGIVRALEGATGTQRWSYAAAGPVEAAPVVIGDMVFVGDRGGQLTALNVATGEERWGRAVPSGGALSSPPVAMGELVVVVDNYGYLAAFNQAGGALRWASVESEYIGPPVVLGDALVVAGANGVLHRLDAQGRRQERWDAASVRASDEEIPTWHTGPSVGGGAVWIGDNQAVIRRLGPPIANAPRALDPAWLKSTFNPPFQAHNLAAAPLVYGAQVVVLDEDGNVYLVEPDDGKAERIATLPPDNTKVIAAAAVADEVLLAARGTALYARHLPDGAALWSFTSPGTSRFPPVVAGDTVVWLTQQKNEPNGILHAIELATGRERWQAPLADFVAVGGAVIADDAVYISTPPRAYDLQTGRLRWQATLPGQGFGGLALDAATQRLFVAQINGNATSIAALNTADGSVAWQTLTPTFLNLLEAPQLAGATVVVPLGDDQGSIIGLDAQSGAERWRYQPNIPRWGGVTVTDDRVWFILANAQLVALASTDGSIRARSADLGLSLSSSTPFAQRPLVVARRIIMPTALALLAFNRE